jgi:hypothetical protein
MSRGISGQFEFTQRSALTISRKQLPSVKTNQITCWAVGFEMNS